MRTRKSDRRPRLAAEIRAEMARQGLTQTRLSATTGIATSSLHTKLKGQTGFWFDELEQIAQVLGVPLSDLVARSDEVAA